MDYKWIGALLIISGCGGYGFLLSLRDIREIASLKELIRILEFMAWELQFQMTPLPEVCLHAGNQVSGPVGEAFTQLSEELETNLHNDVSNCMDLVLQNLSGLPERTKDAMILLGQSLGRFDLNGQLKGLEAVRNTCMQELSEMEANKQQRMHTYQTLGLCTGAALAILLV